MFCGGGCHYFKAASESISSEDWPLPTEGLTQLLSVVLSGKSEPLERRNVSPQLCSRNLETFIFSEKKQDAALNATGYISPFLTT